RTEGRPDDEHQALVAASHADCRLRHRRGGPVAYSSGWLGRTQLVGDAERHRGSRDLPATDGDTGAVRRGRIRWMRCDRDLDALAYRVATNTATAKRRGAR